MAHAVQSRAAPGTVAAFPAPWGWLFLRLLLLVLLLAGGARAEVEVPPLKARVTDLAGTLDAGQRAALEQRLAAFEAAKGSQITRPRTTMLIPMAQIVCRAVFPK